MYNKARGRKESSPLKKSWREIYTNKKDTASDIEQDIKRNKAVEDLLNYEEFRYGPFRNYYKRH
jgi:hypothetical protein